jgi:hypothetical protein
MTKRVAVSKRDILSRIENMGKLLEMISKVPGSKIKHPSASNQAESLSGEGYSERRAENLDPHLLRIGNNQTDS